MKSLIRKLLREVMISHLNNWESNISDFGDVLVTLISKDSESGDKLYLFVGFNKLDDLYEFSYSFMVLDKDDNPKSNYLIKRSDVAKFIPDDIKNKKMIFPIIEFMTKKLLNNKLPDEILRRTSEPLKDGSLARYEIITNIMVNEYGYKVIKKNTDKYGITYWRLSRLNINDKNKDMDESYEIGGLQSIEQTFKDTFDWVLPLLKAKNKSADKKQNSADN